MRIHQSVPLAAIVAAMSVRAFGAAQEPPIERYTLHYEPSLTKPVTYTTPGFTSYRTNLGTCKVEEHPVEAQTYTQVPKVQTAWGIASRQTIERRNGQWVAVSQPMTTKTLVESSDRTTTHRYAYSLTAGGTLSSFLETTVVTDWQRDGHVMHQSFVQTWTITIDLNSATASGSSMWESSYSYSYPSVYCQPTLHYNSVPKHGYSFGPDTVWAMVDSDLDSIPDDVETKPYVYFDRHNVRRELELAKLGANPRRKDVFVEIDWMEGPHGSHRPKAAAVEKVIAAFANAPVVNPDGSRGITLHVDYGQSGLLNQGNAVPEQRFIDWPKYYSIMEGNFTRAYSRYIIFAHDLHTCEQGPTGCYSGQALNGNTAEAFFLGSTGAVVTLGSFTNGTGDVAEQAGTLMHELGHTLGLAHGGRDFDNNKPNYISVMNYSFQNGGLSDYSGSELAPLNELGGLQEAAGIGSPQLTVYWCPGQTSQSARGVFSLPGTSIDWNCNISRSDANVTADVNGDGAYTVLAGAEDWHYLRFWPWTAPLGQPLARPVESDSTNSATTVVPAGELTPDIDAKIPKPWKVAAALNSHREAVGFGERRDLWLTVTNLGIHADSYSVTGGVPDGLTISVGMNSISLAPGQSTNVPVSVTVASTTFAGPAYATFDVRSTTKPSVIDQAVLEVMLSISKAAPQRLSATPTTSSTVHVTWEPLSGAARYEVWRNNGAGYARIGETVGTTYSDAGLVSNAAYLYRVRGVSLTAEFSLYSNTDLATTALFADDPLLTGTPVRAAHILQLRTAIAAVRSLAALPAASFGPISARVSAISASHFVELRTALNQARVALSLSPTSADVLPGATIRAADLDALRFGIR